VAVTATQASALPGGPGSSCPGEADAQRRGYGRPIAQSHQREEHGHFNRERVLRTLTFWLRPEFVLRVVNRFQKIAGFDRSIALASAALTATIPLSLLGSSLRTQLGGKSTADRIIERYDLTGGGAEAVYDIFAPPTGVTTSIGVVGAFFLLIAVLSFTRAVQRLFEQSWELEPLSVRNTLNGLLWIGGLTLYVGLTGAIHALLGQSRIDILAAVVAAPLAAAFLLWSGWVLSAKRIARRDLVPFAVLGASLLGIYSVGASVYVPHLFSTYASRYGVIGAVFAMISALFCIMVVVVGSAAAGREIRDELDRIARGERPAENEIRRQWDVLTADARLRWEMVRSHVPRRRA
jgi:membrane protein